MAAASYLADHIVTVAREVTKGCGEVSNQLLASIHCN